MAHTLHTSESTRWLAVSRRDRTANSSFFYGVVSTRIFCRPTCPGRVARRSNVVFFDDLDQATKSGYRSCKRCQPCSETWSRGSEGRTLAHCLRDLIAAAETNGTPWTVEGFARDLGISGAHLHREFKKHCGLTPKSFGASLTRDTHLRLSPVGEGVQTEEPRSGDVLEREAIDANPALRCQEQQEGNTTPEPPFCGDLGTESFSTEDPSLDFLDILALEEFLQFDDD